MNTITASTNQTLRAFGDMASAARNKIAGIADIAAVIVPSVFILGTAALESGQTGYSPITDTVSELVWCTGGWLEAMLFALNGLFLLLFAARLHRCCGDLANKAGTAMLALAGLSFLTISVCPTLAPGAAPSFTSQVHEYTARGISAIFPLACLFLALSWKKLPAYKTIGNATLVFGAVGLVLNCIGLLYVAGELPWIGALERLIIVNGFAWLAVLGLHFCHVTHTAHLKPARRNLASLVNVIRVRFEELTGHFAPSAARVPVYSTTKNSRTRNDGKSCCR
jgi:hypothetical protein